ncbi:Argininosuccinate lyase [Frankliniella fusca]|uniref:Argininosuccinate lyase n=1 Tax=Frankliniella fusca TaxID=407009 RepID=A0AAE1LRN9_9NEOP|nr:Argininosuccinate lyase [Frankliniella fusca]
MDTFLCEPIAPRVLRNLSFMSLDMGIFSTTSWTYSTISGSSSTGSLRQFRDNKSARCRSLPVNLRDDMATGCLSCSKQHPRPNWLASA